METELNDKELIEFEGSVVVNGIKRTYKNGLESAFKNACNSLDLANSKIEKINSYVNKNVVNTNNKSRTNDSDMTW